MEIRQVSCAREVRTNAQGEIRFGDSCVMDLSRDWGNVSCVYIDPPYFTGDRFILRQRVGREGWSGGKRHIDLPAYADTWPDRESYLAALEQIIRQAQRLLREDGALFVHVEPRVDAHVRLLLDRVFGEKNFVNQIIWAYQSGGRSKNHYSRKHDVIFFYRKSPALRFDITAVPVDRMENRQNHMKRTVDENGRPCRTIRSGGKTYVYYDDEPVYPGDVWNDLSHLQQKDPQRTGYDTQKPLSLLSRVLLPVSAPGDLVADLCAGSGTTGMAAALHGRRFLLTDNSEAALAVMRRRMISSRIRFNLQADTVTQPAVLQAQVFPGLGFDDIRLDSLIPPSPWPDGITGLDGLDQWSVGQWRDGTFFAIEDAVRSRANPDLPRILQMPMNTPDLAVLLVDILGRRYCFRLDPTGGANP